MRGWGWESWGTSERENTGLDTSGDLWDTRGGDPTLLSLQRWGWSSENMTLHTSQTQTSQDTMFLWNTKGDVSVTLLIAPLFGSYFLTVLFLFEGQQLCRWGCPSWDNSRGAGSKWWRLLLWRYSWRWRIRVWRTLDIVTRWIFLACPSHWSPRHGCG